MRRVTDWRPARARSRSAGRWAVLAAVLTAFLLGGCASRKQLFQVQGELSTIRADVDTLKRQQREALQMLSALDAGVHEVQTKTEYGSTALEEKVQALAARLDEIITRMDRSLAPLEEFIRRQSAEDTSQSATMGVDYYDAAQRDLSQGNYDLAEVGFLQFLDANPQSDLADDARYGLAETYYARKRYDEAIEEYERVVAMNPKGGKTPAALLKLGLCHKAEGDRRNAQETWQRLVKDFPYSEESKVAQQRLSELKSKE